MNHGTDHAYRSGCRCHTCVTGNTMRCAKYRIRAVPGLVRLHNDVDEVAVEQVVGGRQIPLGTAERNRVIDILDSRGLSIAQIARRVGCADRTVVRRRSARRSA